jgi:DNA (cytosine-5)-methyltransferase 1
LDLGLERAGMRCVAQVEIDPFCRRVLAKHWPDVPRFEDVRTVTAESLRDVEAIDVIAGGFPCQDISTANHAGRGIDGAKSGLWSEFMRLVCDFRPRFVLVENVANLLSRGMGRVLGDLAASGYDAEWDCIPAWPLGADIARERVFIVAQPEQERREGILRGELGFGFVSHEAWGTPDSLDTPDDRALRIESWLREPAILRSLNGVPAALVERQLGGFGNAVCPQVGEWIGRRIVAAAETAGVV